MPALLCCTAVRQASPQLPPVLGVLGGFVAACGAGSAAAPPPRLTTLVLPETPRAADRAIPPSTPASEPTAFPQTRSCRCGVLDFESDGPPTGDCTLTLAADGAATLSGKTAKPKLTALWTPKPRDDRRPGAFYAFEGEFDFDCRDAWCGHQSLSVLSVGEHDYRIVVARSDDGPPSHVLWVTCAQQTGERSPAGAG